MPDPSRLASVAVVGGSLDGLHFEPADVVGEVLIGSDPDCHLVVDLPSISPLHVRLWTELDHARVYDTHAPSGVYVNGDRVSGQEAVLRAGDKLWLGPPAGPESVCLECRFEPWAEVLPQASAAEEPAEAVGVGAVSNASESDPFFVGADAVVDASEPIVAAAASADEPIEMPALVVTASAPVPPVQTDAPDDFFVASEPLNASPSIPPPPIPTPPPAAPAPAVPAGPVPPKPPAATFKAAAAVPGMTPPKLPAPSATPRPKPEAAPPAVPARPAAVASASASRPASPGPQRRQPAAGARPAAARPPARTARRSGSGMSWLRPAAMALGGLALAGVLGAGAWFYFGGSVRVDGVDPARVRVGQRATVSGTGFASDAAALTVLFDEKAARVLAATPTKLEVQVPEVVAEAGSERRVNVVVRQGRQSSAPFSVSVTQGPRVHAISPEAALPGEEVSLAGSGLGLGAVVHFGAVVATAVESNPQLVRVVVPELPRNTSVPVRVTIGGVESNTAPFTVGHLPVVTGVSPASASPGDVVQISGAGFQTDPAGNDVRIGGQPALVVSLRGGVLQVVVPRVGVGDLARPVELRVPGNPNVGTATLQVASPPDTVEARFVAEPFTVVPGSPHAVVSTGLGPAFVLAAAAGRTAGERALEAATRLNEAVALLRTTLGLTIEARSLAANPTLGLAGRADALLAVTEEDVKAYGEDWGGLRGRGGAVTPGRLARWWEALARDLVLLLVRGEKPHFAADLAPEGRVLGQLFEAARKRGAAGVPRDLIETSSRPPVLPALRLLALRVPPSVKEPVVAAAEGRGPVPAATAQAPRLLLEGTFRGSETESGEQRYLTVTFQKVGGSISYEGGITLTMPLVSAELAGRDEVRFVVQIRGGLRYYLGKWDGEKLQGSISTDREGQSVVATFTLHR